MSPDGPERPAPRRAKKRPIARLSFWRDLSIVVALVFWGLINGAGFLVPLVVSLMLFVLITATIDRVEAIKIGGRHVPRWLAHILGLSVVVSLIGGAVAIMWFQISDVVDAYPRYRYELEQIVFHAREFVGTEQADTASRAFENVDYSGLATYLASGAGTVVAGLLLIMLYVPFMMVERKSMRRKLYIAIRERGLTDEIDRLVRSIATSLQNYVVVKTFVSLLTGLFSYAVFKPLGLDFAETWALLTFLLNFIPSVGSVIAVIFPALVSLVQFDSLTPFLIIVLGCGLVQGFIGNILEPAVAGNRLNLSALTVVIALTFWAAVWGVAGALLSVPITVGILIIMAEFPSTRPVAILMSGSGRLTPFTSPPGTAQTQVAQTAPDDADPDDAPDPVAPHSRKDTT